MNRIDGIYQEHSDAIDAIVSDFTAKFEALITKVSEDLRGTLTGNLKTTYQDTIAATSGNRKLLTGLDGKFDELMDTEGLQDLLKEFTDSFNGQFEWFNKVLESISGELVQPLPAVTFKKSDLVALDMSRIASQDVIRAVVDKVGTRAKMQALQSIGALTPKQLTTQLENTLGVSTSEAENLADTTISTFYRTISDKGFEMIEEDLPGFEVRYNYNGPLDKLNRPFCLKHERLALAGKTYTREEIAKLNNGQGLSVRLSCGGYRCRHQWMISVDDMKAQQASKGKPEKTKTKVTRDKVATDLNARRAMNSLRMSERLGVPHPIDQIAAIRSNVETSIAKRRATNV